MIKIVVSTNHYDYMNFKCIPSLQNIEWENVECLVFHSTRDNDVDAILELSRAGDCVKKVIYINQRINSLYYGLFAGMNADIYNDENMLNDEETLSYLVDEYGNTGMTIKAPSNDMETISKFVATVSKENVETLSKLVKNNLWLQTLETSLKSVETALVRTDEANVGMVEMFNKTSEIISALEEGQTRTTEEIEKLSNYLAKIEENSNKNSNNNNMFFFSTFQVPNTIPKVLYIRVYSPCRYLISFISAYQHYLKMTKQVNSKILIAVPRLKQFIKKYEKLPRLAQDTINTNRNLASQEIFVTTEPKPQILNAFFNMKSDVYFVIDMMFGDALIQGAKVSSLDAVSCVSDIARFGLKSDRCIVPHIGTNLNIVIPHFQKYNTPGLANSQADTTSKRTKYFEGCKDKSFARLDKLLSL